jgi:hypothetical protein
VGGSTNDSWYLRNGWWGTLVYLGQSNHH